MEDTKGQDSGSGPSESGRRSDWRHETESRSMAENRENEVSGLGINELGQIRVNVQQQQRLSPRDVEMQRRSHELAQSSAYPVRPGKRDCSHYLKTGVCGYESGCRFNHPPKKNPVRHRPPNCKFFPRGTCKKGTDCRFYHQMARDGAEPALLNVPGLARHQARTTDWKAGESSGRLDKRRHETGSSSTPEKRARTIQHSQERDPRERFEDTNQIRDAGFKLPRLSTSQGASQLALDRQNIEEQRLREIARKRTESRMKLDQVQQTVKFNEAHGVEEALRELVIKRKEGDRL